MGCVRRVYGLFQLNVIGFDDIISLTYNVSKI